MLRARIADAQGQHAEALDALSHIPDSAPIAPSALLLAGQIEARKRHHARAAEAHFLRALERAPDQIQSRRELAYLYALHRRSECDEQFRELARRVPLDYRMAFAWVQSDLDLFDPDEAIRALAPMVAADPEDRWSRLAREELPDEAIIRPGRGGARPAPRFRPGSPRACGPSWPWIAATRRRGDGWPGADPTRARPDGGRPRQAGPRRRRSDRRRRPLPRRDPPRSGRPQRPPGAGHGPAVSSAIAGPMRRSRAAADRDRLRRLVVACGKSRAIDGKAFHELADLCERIGRDDQARAWYEVALAADPGDIDAAERLERLRERAASGGR